MPAKPKVAPKAAKPAAKKSAKAAPAKKSVKRAVKKAAPSMSEVEHQHAVERAEHQHQDPRGTAGVIGKSGSKVNPENYGEARARGVPRLNVISNWFRKGKGR